MNYDYDSKKTICNNFNTFKHPEFNIPKCKISQNDVPKKKKTFVAFYSNLFCNQNQDNPNFWNIKHIVKIIINIPII